MLREKFSVEITTVLAVANITIAVLLAVLGWLINSMRSTVAKLEKADEALSEKVQRVEVLVAGEYVKRAEFHDGLNRIFDKLDSMDRKLDTKADKTEFPTR